MRCSQAILLMEQEIHSRLPLEKKRRIDKHLEACPDCASYHLLRKEMAAVLDELMGRTK